MVNLIFVLSAILNIIAFIFTDMLILRVITIIAMLGYVTGGLIAGILEPGMKALIFFSLIAVIVNISQIFRIIVDRIPILLPEHIRAIYRESFYILTTREFYKLYKLAHHKNYKSGAQIATQDQIIPELCMIERGLVNIYKDKTLITNMGPGYFIGEMSFLQGGLANATVEAADSVDCIIWSKTDLKKLQTKNPVLSDKLKEIIAINLIKKNDLKPVSFKLTS